MKKRIFLTSLLLCISMLLACFTACNTDSDNTGTQESNGSTVEPVVDTPPAEPLYIFKNKSTNFQIVYPHEATDDLTNAANRLFNRLSEYVNTAPAYGTDRELNASDQPQILIGDTNRAESAAARKMLKGSSYGIQIVNGNVVIVATREWMIHDAVNAFLNAMQYESNRSNGFLKGDLNVLHTYDGYTRDRWNLRFPAYEGGILVQTAYTNNFGYDSISAPNNSNYKEVLAYNTNKIEFQIYVQKLKAEGYTVTEVNNDDFIKSYWVEKNGSRMYIYLSVNAGEARFILDQNEAVRMEDFSYTYAKKTGDKTSLYLYGLHMDKKEGKNVGEKYNDGTTNLKASNCGQLFIIKLADNSVVIIDGGADNQMSKTAAEGLDAFLHEITGTPTGGKVKIACWLITHSHLDHFGGFARFLINYHAKYDLQRICFNFNYKDSNMPKLFDEHLDVYYPNLKYYRPHTGETIQLADVTLDILYTCEDNVDAKTGELIKEHFSWNNTYGIDQNNSSIVARITFDGKSFMLLGDIAGAAEDVIMRNYSAKSLKVDIMQVSHHGFNNVSDFVAAMNPSISLYPQSKVGAMKANNGSAYQVLKNVIQNTKGGESNLYYAGECTACVEVVNGELVVTTREVVSSDYNGRWTMFTPF